MKISSLMITAFVALVLTISVSAQEKPGGPKGGAKGGPVAGEGRVHTVPPRSYHPKPDGSGEPVGKPTSNEPSTDGVGICLIGKQYVFVVDEAEADICDALMWVNAVHWAQNQRRLIDDSTSSDHSTAIDSFRACSSCSGTCQTISWNSGRSTYEGVDADGGQNPSECLADIRKICESLETRYFASAHCGN